MARRTLAVLSLLAFTAELLGSCSSHATQRAAGVIPLDDTSRVTTRGGASATGSTAFPGPSLTRDTTSTTLPPSTTIPDPLLVDVPDAPQDALWMVDAYGRWAGAFRRAQIARDPQYPELLVSAAPAMVRVSSDLIRRRLELGITASVPEHSINEVRVIRVEPMRPGLTYLELCETDDTRYSKPTGDPVPVRHSRIEAQVTLIGDTWNLTARESNVDESCNA